jgi:hypothetical protein
MPATKPNPILRVFPSLTDIAYLAPVILLFVRLDGVKTMLSDGDTGWHIRAGEWMLANGKVPTQDMFSFTKAGEPWYAWEWLADIILAILHQKFGLAGPVTLGIFLIGIASVLLFRLCRRHASNDFFAIGVTAVAMAASSIHWLARPHLFTFVFIMITLHLLERSEVYPKVIWWIPVLVVPWVNLHGAFFVSIILLGMTATGKFLTAITAAETKGWREAVDSAKPYVVVGAVSAAASLLNPYGWNLHKHIYTYLTEKYHFEHIVEFQTLSFHAPVAVYFETLLFLGIIAAAWSVFNRRFTDAVMLIAWLHLSLIAGRNIPIFAFVAAPFVCRFLSEALISLKTANVAAWIQRSAASVLSYGEEFAQMDRVPRIHLTSAVASVLLFFAIANAPVDSSKLRAEYDRTKYPSAAVMAKLEGHRVFTNDEWGDYLIYSLYPKTKVFVDGRSDFYGPEFSLRYLDVMDGHYEWASILRKHNVDAILLPAKATLTATLKESPEWRATYDDSISILFLASGKAETQAKPGSAASLASGRDAKPAPKIGQLSDMADQPKPQPTYGHMAS